jgi:hypothetical protein
VRSKIVIALTLSGLFVFPTTAALSHAASARENKLVSTIFKTAFRNIDLPNFSRGLPLATLFAVFSEPAEASAFPAADLSVGKEQQALILLGCAFLLVGIIWLRSARRAPHSVASQNPTSPPAPMSKPEPRKDPVWIDLELGSEPSETCNQEHISV